MFINSQANLTDHSLIDSQYIDISFTNLTYEVPIKAG
jgi:hypothetical protein